MATCSSCGKETRDDDWACGACGAPVAASGAAGGASSSGYAPSYEPPPDAYMAPATYGAPAAAATPRSGMSRGTVTIIILAALAVVAIIAVWFVFVRGTGGTSPFVGTWNKTAGGDGSVVIKLRSGEFKVTMSGKDASGTQKSYTTPAHLNGADLEITVDDFVKATGNEEQAAQAKAVFELMIKDFRLVFALRDPTHLEMQIEGTPLAGGVAAQATQSAVVLVKSD